MPTSRAPFSQRACSVPSLGRSVGLGVALLALGAWMAPGAGQAAAGPSAADPVFAALLRQGDLTALDGACGVALKQGDGPRLRQLQQRLLTIHPAPQPLAVVLANADALLRCQAPDAALRVLGRISPAVGPERSQWLQLQWRAAQAGLHHALAADALERLAAGNLARLAALELPVAERQDGTWVMRPALDLLADHLESLGRRQRAAEVLLAGSSSGPVAAERLAQAVLLLDGLPAVEQERLLELALEQAAAAGSWGLVAQILDQQLALVGSSPQASARAAERRLRLSGALDDAYGEWVWRRRDPASLTRQGELERQLRSPRSPGGHAASPPSAPQP